MNANSMFVVLLGLFVRLIIPIAVTALIVFWLRKLDKRWQEEAEKERHMLVNNELPCWIEQGLSVEESRLRSAMSEQPCWQTHRSVNGYLREECLECEVFRLAPAPDPKSKISHAHV